MSDEGQHQRDAAAHHREASAADASLRAQSEATLLAQTEREKFVRRTFLIVVLTILLVVIGLMSGGFLFSQNRTLGAVEDEFRKHERNESTIRRQLETFIREQHTKTRKELAALQRRVDQLERFIKEQGLSVPPERGPGSKSSAPNTNRKKKPGKPRSSPGPRRPDCLPVLPTCVEDPR